jgi:hypothetical protein
MLTPLKTEIVTAETLEQFRRSHGAAVRIGDTVQVRQPERYTGYRIFESTIRTLEYIEELKRRP